MDIGDYTYIIIGIVATIVSAINQKSKRKKAMTKRTVHRPSTAQMETASIPYENTEIQQILKNSVHPSPNKAQQDDALEKPLTHMPGPEEEGISALSGDMPEKNKMDTPSFREKPISSKAFDARTAIIYAEIINRPYQ